MVGVKKECFVITLQNYSILYLKYRVYYAKLHIVLHKLQTILHKTANHTTQKLRSYYAKLQEKVLAHALHTKYISHALVVR